MVTLTQSRSLYRFCFCKRGKSGHHSAA